jgi:hypothetical protein
MKGALPLELDDLESDVEKLRTMGETLKEPIPQLSLLPWKRTHKKREERKAALKRREKARKSLRKMNSDANGVYSKLMMLEQRFVELQERAKAKLDLELKNAQINEHDKRQKRVKEDKRIRALEEESKARAPPDYWEKVKAKSAPDGFAAIALDRTDPTFAALGRLLETDKAKLKKSGADRSGTSHDTLKLACAWRLENPVQWGKYMSGVQQVANDMERIRQAGVKPTGGAPPMTGVVASDLPDQLRANVNEAFLMHGTGTNVLINILSTGMNERFAGTAAGAAYGEGSYLAEDAGKNDQYTKVDSQYDESSEVHKRLYAHGANHHPGKVFYILVCRVALGHHVRTQDPGRKAKSFDTGRPVFPISFRELDTVVGVSPPVHHHSLLAPDPTPPSVRYREFIVFHSDYIYPEYLLAYQRFESDGSSLKGPLD